EGFSQRAHDGNRGRDRAFAVQTWVAHGQVLQQRRVASECLLVRGDDRGAAAERGANPLGRVRCAAGFDENVDRRVGGESRSVVREWRWGEPGKVRPQHRDTSDAQSCSSDLLERGPTFRKGRREGGANSSAANETDTQLDRWHSLSLLPPVSPRRLGT